jgi:aminoglycoside phosphotransferase
MTETPQDTASNPGGAASDVLAAQLPGPIADLAQQATWHVCSVRPTGTTSWRLDTPTGPVLLTAAPAGSAVDALAAARRRLTWLAGVLPVADRTGEGAPVSDGPVVPAVLASAADPDCGDAYLATTLVGGTPASDDEHSGSIEALLAALAVGLHTVHDLPADICPFTRSVGDLLSEATVRVAAGAVDPATLSPAYQRYTPDRLLELAIAGRPDSADSAEDRVVTQGAPLLRETLVEHGQVVGYTDWSRLAVAHRYHDIAIITRDLAASVSPHALGPFAAAYGLDTPDLVKLDFFVLLVELLGLP